ncbi:hypothetical protein BTURTLESOX_1103 [bacterium endosymbiont of Bathymodiolus sp. 5 South]|nr:hypothetical protein BTURTLESOX_1103 [bacterium endosymbiont of Bathymodiolus sp. 5 South]
MRLLPLEVFSLFAHSSSKYNFYPKKEQRYHIYQYLKQEMTRSYKTPTN